MVYNTCSWGLPESAVYLLLFFPFFLYLITIYLLIHFSIMSFLPSIYHLPPIYYHLSPSLHSCSIWGVGFVILEVALQSGGEGRAQQLLCTCEPAKAPLAQHTHCCFSSVSREDPLLQEHARTSHQMKKNSEGNVGGSKSQCLLLFPNHIPTAQREMIPPPHYQSTLNTPLPWKLIVSCAQTSRNKISLKPIKKMFAILWLV